jgi:uncharacterized protein (UPF0335 family)
MAQPGNSNGYDPQTVKGLISRIEECEAEILREHMTYMGKVKELREDIGEILEEGKSKGIPRKALKLVIKTRKKQAELEAIREDLEGDEQDSYDLLRHALGDLADTELGQQAMARQAEKQKEASDALDKIGRGSGASKH